MVKTPYQGLIWELYGILVKGLLGSISGVLPRAHMGDSKNKGLLFGRVLIMRVIVYFGLFWGPHVYRTSLRPVA